jgi:hypothetical protein
MPDPMPVVIVGRKHFWQPFLVLFGFAVALLACVWLSWLRPFIAAAVVVLLCANTSVGG